MLMSCWLYGAQQWDSERLIACIVCTWETYVDHDGNNDRRVAFGYISAAMQLLFLFMLLVWHNREAEALDRVALAHSEA